MDNAVISRLEAVLTAHESVLAREQDRIDQAYLADALFAQQFAALKTAVILPTFAGLETELKRHGHTCKVIEIDELYPGDSDGGGGSVKCEFYPKGWDRGEGASLAAAPSLTVSCDKTSKTVTLSECTVGPLDRGWSGELAAFSLQDVTGEAIAAAFVALIEKVLLDKSFIAKSIKDLRPSRTRPRNPSASRPEIGCGRHAA